jgi:DNA-binding transcriptional MerR regulator
VQEEGYVLDLEYTLSSNVDAAAFDPAGKEFFMDQNEQRTYTISEVVEQTGLTADTLRFYEKIGLLGSPERGGGRQRMYTSVDIGKIRFVSHLKRTHMPLQKIREYIRRYNEQDETGCYDLLDEHRQSIERQIDELKETLQIIGFKLEHFQEIKDGK